MKVQSSRFKVQRLLGAFLLVVVGCRSYEPAPIDWEKERAVWMESGEVTFSSLDDVARLALVGNPQLNQMRLKHMNAQKVAQATGRWDDPELDADFLRIVDSTKNPLLGGVTLSFTLPLSGVKGLERRTAEAYSRADAAEIVAAEQETAVSARCTAVRLFAANGTIRTLKAFANDRRVTEALVAAEKLSEAGELSRTETASARLRRHQRLHRLREAEAEAAEAEQTLRKLLGIAPGVKMRFEGFEGVERFEGFERSEGFERLGVAHSTSPLTPSVSSDSSNPSTPSTPSNLSNLSTPLAFVRHPKVQAAVCRLEGGEVALETEIHRQYPDLKLGPAYSREDGMDRIGLVAGMTLPLWNRNRKGIAEAEGTRDAARAEAVKVWREVVLEADAARRTLARLMDHSPEKPPKKGDADALSDAGEINALEYLAVREECLESELMERDWCRDVQLAEENLKKYEL